ncbi:hypothetical protein MLD38_004418 [Melastoma candidum]|uniref:Uncharacterized protein n=1 Tax=Melastoma candidum TaxID=119954 RepID=A0ACB9S5C4_9MYRT|nr:hypothetical protein MLD38_004418 [Melastoma candidum]
MSSSAAAVPPRGGWSHAAAVVLSSTQHRRPRVVALSFPHLSSHRAATGVMAVRRSASCSLGDADKRKLGSHLKSLFRKGSLLGRRTFFRSKKVRSIVLLNLVTFIYASEIAVLKEVESSIDPAMFTVVRFVSSAIPLVPFMIKGRHDTVTRNYGLELGLWVSLGYISQALGMLTSDAGRASFLSMFTVILVPILDGMLGAFVPIHIWSGSFLSIIGVGMLESSGSPPCVGDILNFFSAVFFGIHMLRTEHISRRTDRKKFLPLLGYEVLVVAFSSIAWFFLGSSTDVVQDPTTLSWSWAMIFESMLQFPWVAAIYTGVLSTGLCLWVEMAAMRDVSATETAIIYGLEPIWGACFAWFLLEERWGISGWIGAALILVGSMTVQVYGALPPAKSTETMNDGLRIQNEKGSLSSAPASSMFQQAHNGELMIDIPCEGNEIIGEASEWRHQLDAAREALKETEMQKSRCTPLMHE